MFQPGVMTRIALALSVASLVSCAAQPLRLDPSIHATVLIYSLSYDGPEITSIDEKVQEEFKRIFDPGRMAKWHNCVVAFADNRGIAEHNLNYEDFSQANSKRLRTLSAAGMNYAFVVYIRNVDLSVLSGATRYTLEGFLVDVDTGQVIWKTQQDSSSSRGGPFLGLQLKSRKIRLVSSNSFMPLFREFPWLSTKLTNTISSN